MTKKCSHCKEEKKLEDFKKDKRARDGRCSWCKSCHSTSNKKYLKRWSIKFKHGITLEQYEDMLSSQNGCCAICGTDAPGGQGRFHVDHDHSTGKIQGILCNGCNRGMGFMKDSVVILEQAANYLKSHTALPTQGESVSQTST